MYKGTCVHTHVPISKWLYEYTWVCEHVYPWAYVRGHMSNVRYHLLHMYLIVFSSLPHTNLSIVTVSFLHTYAFPAKNVVLWFYARVARWVCEKIVQKIAQPILCQNKYIIYTFENSSPKFRATCVIMEKPPKSQQFAQSGHTGFTLIQWDDRQKHRRPETVRQPLQVPHFRPDAHDWSHDVSRYVFFNWTNSWKKQNICA
jgi:hypothetical protein